eukprot:362321-Chlamydomonas_euryale.AAC.5
MGCGLAVQDPERPAATTRSAVFTRGTPCAASDTAWQDARLRPDAWCRRGFGKLCNPGPKDRSGDIEAAAWLASWPSGHLPGTAPWADLKHRKHGSVHITAARREGVLVDARSRLWAPGPVHARLRAGSIPPVVVTIRCGCRSAGGSSDTRASFSPPHLSLSHYPFRAIPPRWQQSAPPSHSSRKACSLHCCTQPRCTVGLAAYYGGPALARGQSVWQLLSASRAAPLKSRCSRWRWR